MGSLRHFLLHRLWRYLLWTAVGAIALLVAVFGAALLLVDQDWVQARVQRRLSELAHGEITWEALHLRLLPVPGAQLTGARAEVAGVAHVLLGEAEVDLRLRPLLSGHVEIARLRIDKPEARIRLPAATPAKGPSAQTTDPLASIGAVVDALRRYAPQLEIDVEDGTIEVVRASGPLLRLSDVSLRARSGDEGMQLALSSASTLWSRLTADASLRFADMSVQARAEAAGLKLQGLIDEAQAGSPLTVELPTADANVTLRSAGRTSLEGEFDVRVPELALRRGKRRLEVRNAKAAGRVAASPGEARLTLSAVQAAPYLPAARAALALHEGGKRIEASADVPRLDLATLRDAALALYGDVPEVKEYLSRVRKGEATGARVRLEGNSWEDLGDPARIAASVALSGAEFVPPVLERPVTAIGGELRLEGNALHASRVQGTLGASTLRNGSLRYAWTKDSLAGDAAVDLNMPQALALAHRLLPKAQKASLQSISSVAGRLRGRASAQLVKGRWRALADFRRSNAALQLEDLPGPVTLSAANVRANASSIAVERAAVSFLDSRVVAGVRLDGYAGRALTVTGSVSQGTASDRTAQWLIAKTGLPPGLAPAMPLAFSADRLRWRGGALDASARLSFPAGQQVSLTADWKPGVLDVSRLHLSDAQSDAAFTLHLEHQRLLASFDGELQAASVEAMMKHPIQNTGSVRGNLRVLLDQRRPEATSAHGRIRLKSIDLTRILQVPVRVEHLDFSADAQQWTLNEALLSVAKQSVTLRGDARRGPHGPVIDAEIETPGLTLDSLVPAKAEAPAGGESKSIGLEHWPLPVTGRVYVRADFVEWKGRRVAPLLASLDLQRERVELDVAEANLCGLSLPLTVTAVPERYNARISIHAKNQSLDQISHCMSGEGLVLTGDVDLDVELRTQGAPADLVRNLEGRVSAQARKGRVHKFGLLANLLAYVKGQGLLDKEAPGIDRQGFPYKELNVKGRLGGGRFTIDESDFQSPALGLVATGWIGVPGGQTSLTVLVAPFGRVDNLLGKIPVVGYIFGGSFISLPVQVSGDIRDPLVVPLDPRAIASRVLGIFERTFKLPGKLLMPVEGGTPPPEPAPVDR